jgi:hypothetical protein
MQTIFLESSGALFFNSSSRALGRIIEFPPRSCGEDGEEGQREGQREERTRLKRKRLLGESGVDFQTLHTDGADVELLHLTADMLLDMADKGQGTNLRGGREREREVRRGVVGSSDRLSWCKMIGIDTVHELLEQDLMKIP